MQQNHTNWNENEVSNNTYHANMTYYRVPPQYYNRDTHYVTNSSYQYVQYPYYNYQMPQQYNNQANIQYVGSQNYPQHNNNSLVNYYNSCQYNNMNLSNTKRPIYNNRKLGYTNYNKTGYNCRNNNAEESCESYECQVCNLYFDKKQKLDKHLKNDHIPCIHEGCKFSAPLQILEVHALKHLKNNKGELIVDSPEEIRIWRERRLANHPSNPHKNAVENDSKLNATSSLEDFLRSSMNSFSPNHSAIKFNEQESKSSALVPILNKITPVPSSLYSFLEPEKADRKIQSLEAKIGGPYSYSLSLKRKFNVCKTFLKKKTCKYGTNCTYSHDLAAFKRWKKLQFNLQVPKRPPLLYRLLKSEILVYEELLIRGIIYIVKSNFLQPKQIPLIEELDDNKFNDI